MGPGLVYLNEPNRVKNTIMKETPKLTYAATGMQGWRINMEDAHVAISSYGEDPNAYLFAVFDGHGGKEVAEFAKRHFPEELLQNPLYKEKKYKEALTQTFLKMDVLLSSEGGKKELKLITEESSTKTPKKSSPLFEPEEEEGANGKGCTANVVLIKEEKLYIANAGDSRAIAISKDGTATHLSIDHKPENAIERARISKAGGSVYNGRVEGNLNLSRALGDLQYKQNKALPPEEQMICAYPDVEIKDLTSDLAYVLLGCDGVYETKTSQEIANIILNDKRMNPKIKPTDVVERLLEALISPDYIRTGGAGCDNMTCILIEFKHD